METPDRSRRSVAPEPALAISRKRQDRADILALEVWEIPEDLILTHSARQIVEHIRNGDTEATDAWLTAPLARLHRDSAAKVHAVRIRIPAGRSKYAEAGSRTELVVR